MTNGIYKITEEFEKVLADYTGSPYVVAGFETYTVLPSDPVFALFHPKTINKQERQNNYYDKL